MAAVEQLFEDDYADHNVKPQAIKEVPMAKTPSKPVSNKKTAKPGAGMKKGMKGGKPC